MLKKLLLLCLFLLPVTVQAQRGRHFDYWTFDITASSSSFLSDLGGKNANGSNDPSDLDFGQTGYALGGGFTYHTGLFGIELGSFYTSLSANDNATEKNSRRRRQLQVQTDVVETFAKLHFTIPYKFPGIGAIYVNAGAGFIYYEPKAEIGGTTYKLRPLGTEGQNYLPGMERYSTISPVIPFGIGKSMRFRNGMSLAVEVSMRKTFTDYLDDVSTNYANSTLVAERGGAAAGLLADRSNGAVFNEGDQRGDPTDNDNYFLFGFKFSVPLSSRVNYNTSCSFENEKRVFRRRGRGRW